MSERIPRVSRRKLLQLSAIAPLASLVGSGASTAALAQEAQKCAEIDPDQLNDVVDLARKHCEEVGITFDEPKEEKFRLVASVLWLYFCKGAEHRNAEVQQSDFLEVLDTAYRQEGKNTKKRFGDLIVEQLDAWNEMQHEPRTNSCAFRAGQHAAKHAPPVDNGKKKVKKKEFKKGFEDTEDEVGRILSRANVLVFEDEPDRPGGRGLGC